MEYKDYYKTLGVSRTATEKEIKTAYRRLARKHHPDMNPGKRDAEARFKEINEAYEVLSDPEKRRRYEELGANWSAYQSRGAPSWASGVGGGRVRVDFGGMNAEDLGGFSEFFRTFFGGMRGWPGKGPSGGEDVFGAGQRNDVEGEVELTLEEVLGGATRMIQGAGTRRVEVKIPPGVGEGSRVRVAGEGASLKGKKGDLYLRVRVRQHAQYERRGDDLATTVKVPLTTAVLGGDVEVRTLDSKRVSLKVAPGTPHGRVLRVRGQGLPRLGAKGQRGDLLAKLEVVLPTTLTPRERELFEQLRREGR
jgi:DnaJ-class molecular chaperone